MSEPTESNLTMPELPKPELSTPPAWRRTALASATAGPLGVLAALLVTVQVAWMLHNPAPLFVLAVCLIGYAYAAEKTKLLAGWHAAGQQVEAREVAKLRFEHALREANLGPSNPHKLMDAVGEALLHGVNPDELDAIQRRVHGENGSQGPLDG